MVIDAESIFIHNSSSAPMALSLCYEYFTHRVALTVVHVSVLPIIMGVAQRQELCPTRACFPNV